MQHGGAKTLLILDRETVLIWGFHTVRRGIDPRDHRFRPRFVGVVGYGRICDSGMGPYSPRVALDHAGCMRGVVPVRYQPSRKKQQPLAWIL